MDEKQSNQVVPHGASAPKSVPGQSHRTETPAVLPKPAEPASSSTGQPRAGDNSLSAASTPNTAKPSDGLTAVLEASRAELDRLLTETQGIHERSWRVIHKLLEDSQLRASQAVDACLARFESEVQNRIGGVMATMLQNFEVEAGARLAARLDQALSTAKQRQHSIEQDLAVAVAENRKQLDQISTGAADSLRQHGQRLLADLQKEADRQVGELGKNARQIRTNLEQLAGNFGNELKKRAEEAAQIFQSRSEKTWQEVVERAEKKIGETASAHTAELAKQARQAVDREMSEFLNHALRRFDRSSEAPPPNRRT